MAFCYAFGMADDTETEGTTARALTVDDFITTKQAASLLGVDPWNLKRRRAATFTGTPGPPWYKRLGRIFYKKAEVLAMLASPPAPRPAPKPTLPRFPPYPGPGQPAD